MYTFHSLDVSLEPMEIYSKRAACIYAPVKHICHMKLKVEQ